MPEHLTYRINHPDGTQTFIGAATRSFGAFANPYQLISEEEVLAKLAGIDLPFKTSPERIVGWGGFSVAVRLHCPQGNYIAVLRNLPTAGKGNLINLWQMEKDINSRFKPYTIPQYLVETDGIDHNRMVAKISPEVRGGTLKDLSFLYLMGNSTFLRQYIDLSKQILKEFKDTGTLVDTSGHISESLLKQIYFGLIPFNSINLMLEEGLDKLRLVDCDVKPQIHLLSAAKASQKAGLFLRAAALGSSIPLALATLAIHNLRDKVFDEKPQTENDPLFTEGFAATIRALEEFGADYRVIGSFAVAATIQQSGEAFYLKARRKNLTQRDVDIILLNPERIDLTGLKEDLKELRKGFKKSPIPSISIVAKVGEDENKKQATTQNLFSPVITKIGVDKTGNFYLVYQDISLPIPHKNLEAIDLYYQGIKFRSLKPGVIAGFALTRGGAIKFKDRSKIAKMLKLTEDRIPSVFIDFAKQIRIKYPSKYRNFLAREWLTYLTGGFIGGGQLSKLVHQPARLILVDEKGLNAKPTKEGAVRI